jgi:hypothetical protein
MKRLRQNSGMAIIEASTASFNRKKMMFTTKVSTQMKYPIPVIQQMKSQILMRPQEYPRPQHQTGHFMSKSYTFFWAITPYSNARDQCEQKANIMIDFRRAAPPKHRFSEGSGSADGGPWRAEARTADGPAAA